MINTGLQETVTAHTNTAYGTGSTVNGYTNDVFVFVVVLQPCCS